MKRDIYKPQIHRLNLKPKERKQHFFASWNVSVETLSPTTCWNFTQEDEFSATSKKLFLHLDYKTIIKNQYFSITITKSNILKAQENSSRTRRNVLEVQKIVHIWNCVSHYIISFCVTFSESLSQN